MLFEGNEGIFLCGGAIIAPDIVLSAAHCNFDLPLTNVTITAIFYFRTDLQIVRTCESWVNNPDFNPALNGAPFAYDADWALCKLNEPVAIDQSEVILELNQDDWFPYVGEEVAIMGYGLISDVEPSFPPLMQLAYDTYISNAECNDLWGPSNDTVTYGVTENSLCTFTEDAEVGACGGDSGGPAVVIQGSRHIHVGVTSWGPFPCGILPLPVVYARTSTGYSWIRDTACNELDSIGSLCLPTPSRSSKKDKSASDKSAKKKTKKYEKSAKKGKGGKSMSSKQSRGYTLSIFENESGLTEDEGWQD